MSPKPQRGAFKNINSFSSSHSSFRKGWGWLLLAVFFLGGFGWLGYRYGLTAILEVTNFFANLGNQEEIKDLTYEKIPPSPPLLDPLPEATNSASLIVSGSAEPETEVKLFLNGEEAERIMVDKEGKFVSSKLSLSQGENTFFARVEGKNGAESQDSLRQIIVFDNEAPPLKISSPQDGEIIRGEEKKDITISGETDKDALVSINDRKVVVKLDGSFETSYSLVEGKNKIVVVAEDKAGNKTEETINLTFRP